MMKDENNIIIVFDKDGNIWFSFRDILKSIGYTSIDSAINALEVSQTNKSSYQKILLYNGLESRMNSINVKHNHTFINESGLYEVLSKSTKPLAKLFMTKYFTEIMPQIRQTGKFILNDSDKKKLDKINEKLDNYKQELTYYYDKYKFVPSKNGYLYINQDNSIINGINKVCYKIGYAKDMMQRIREYKVGNFKFKPLCYIPININKKDIETCIKLRNKPHLTKLITDSICYLTLHDLKNEILECITFLKDHICHCLYCKKQYGFDKLNEHKCNSEEKFIDVKIDDILKLDNSKGSKKVKSSKGSKKVKLLKGSKKTKSSKGSKKVKSSKSSKRSKKSKPFKRSKKVKPVKKPTKKPTKRYF